MMKTCKICGKVKDENEFDLHHADVRRNQCKVCVRTPYIDSNLKSKKCIICNVEKDVSEFEFNGRSLRNQCTECRIKKSKEYVKTDRYKEVKKKNDSKPFTILRKKIEFIGMCRINQLITSKKILPKNEAVCIKCGKKNAKGLIEYHHCDYNYLDFVIPLCNSCHRHYHNTMIVVYPKGWFDGVEIPKKMKDKISYETVDDFLNNLK